MRVMPLSEIQQTEIRDRLEALTASKRLDTIQKWLAGLGSMLLASLIYWAGGQLLAIKDAQQEVASDVRVLGEALKASVEVHGQSLRHASDRIDRLEQENQRMRDTIERLMTRVRAESPLQP